MAERKKVLLRLDPAVYDAIAKWAADDLRSVNAQLEYALRLALKGAGRDLRRAERNNPDQVERNDADELDKSSDNANEPDKSSD